MKNIIKAIRNHVDGRMTTLVKAVDAEKNGDVVKITFEITKNVGSKNQNTHTEIYNFEIVSEWSDIYPKREWVRLDEIDDTSGDTFNWMNSFNNEMRMEAKV